MAEERKADHVLLDRHGRQPEKVDDDDVEIISEEEFHATKAAESRAARALHLGKEFRATVQGGMSVADYCAKLKGIADQLAGVREPVSDKALTMQLIHGLDDDRFKDQRELHESMVPFPSFTQVQSRLKIAEIKLQPKGKADPQIPHKRRRWYWYGSASSGDRGDHGYDQQPRGPSSEI